MSSFVSKIALRYLWSRRKEAFITIITFFAIIGVALGVAVLDITMAIMSGFERELKAKIVGQSHIIVHSFGGDLIKDESILEKINAVSDVDAVSPFLQLQVLVTTKRSSKGLLLKALPETGHLAEELRSYLPKGQNLTELFNPSNEGQVLPGIIIGAELQNQLALFPGSSISILTPQVSSTPFGMAPKYKRFLVTSAYKSGLVGYEENLAYTSIANLQRYFKLNGYSGFEIRLKNPEQAREVRKVIQNKLGSKYYVRDWFEQNKDLWDALRLEKQVYFIVLLLLVVLASFSIIATLVMLVMEKRKDIAILMTLGAKTNEVARIFKTYGAVIGLIGTILGTVLGFTACWALQKYGFPLPQKVFPTDTVPVNFSVANFTIVAIAAFLIAFSATWYPARKASRIKPTETLRYE